MKHLPLLLLLLLLTETHTACPDCTTWTGTSADVCGLDGVTYSSDCELLIALCQDGTITFGDGANVNDLPVSIIVDAYKMNDGPCSSDGGGGNCPDCLTVANPQPVCDSSLTAFNSSCYMARKMCNDGIISFDDGVDFTTMSESDFRAKISSYVFWDGLCSGPCPSGTFSNNGQYGPCRQCGPGEFAANNGSTTCDLCPLDSYQPTPGAGACITCPNGTDTLSPGSYNVSQCLEDCVPGHYSTTGKAPCSQCAAGTWSNTTGSQDCEVCGVGHYTDGTFCVGCKMGTYSDTNRTTTCSDCPKGSFSNTTGSTSCVSCGEGTFMNTTGAPACRLCDQGRYSNTTGAVACQQCAPGSYQIELGRPFCYTCPRGTYQPSSGQSSCLQCPKGSYSSSEGGAACTKCPDGMTTVGAGSIDKSECSYTSCDYGNKVVIVNNRVTCEACPLGWYQNQKNQTSCIKCPLDSYQDSEGEAACVRCPQNSITYTGGATTLSDCEGPEIELYTGKSYSGTRSTTNDRRDSLPSNLRGKINSFKVTRGDWYIFSSTRYGGRKIRLNAGTIRSDVTNGNQYPRVANLSPGSFYSIRPVVTNVMCYVEVGLQYTGYRSKTTKGVVCQNWRATSPHAVNSYSGTGVGNHNYCRNPDSDPNGPWCYTTDPNRRWDYCGVPTCKWNKDCYTELGEQYRGYRTKTAGNSYNCNDWYSNWPHPHGYDSDTNVQKYGVGHHRYCRNPAPSSDNRPWCFTTYFFKRWAYCDVPKCEFSSTNYFTRQHDPKGSS